MAVVIDQAEFLGLDWTVAVGNSELCFVDQPIDAFTSE
ncbi:hypothetical protein L313_2477 [Acinetobacter haemolyticus CIP 64.3 = MTCC 9819]|nr:hypothetical protein L313_2477 [Acinetobacter haemolyticus CIP 64.3 = MTCC 9819]